MPRIFWITFPRVRMLVRPDVPKNTEPFQPASLMGFARGGSIKKTQTRLGLESACRFGPVERN